MPLRDAIDRPVGSRPCAVAGRFYPADPDTLRHEIADYFRDADTRSAIEDDDKPVRAIIAPHAGYIYSAPIAASAYRRVAALRGHVNRVVLIGPAHYVPFSGLACSSAQAFQTPLGDVPVDTDAVSALTDRHDVDFHDEAHAPEHGLEVHLPLLIESLSPQDSDGIGFTLVPLLFGHVGYEPTAEALAPFFDDPQTLIVVSSDLSHYHDYDTAKRIDRDTADAILAGRGDAVVSDRACGHTAIRAVLRCAEQRGLAVAELDLRNSGDTAGPRDRVVGYGAFNLR